MAVTNMIRPYNGESYNVFPWGSAGYIDGNVSINTTFYTNHSRDVLLYLRYSIYNRYNGDEPTIEDIYSNVTRRAMALGCMDGPMFAFFSKVEVSQ